MDNLLGDMMNQAKKVQEEMEKAQKEIEAAEVQGESGAGLVKVVMNGRHDVKKIIIDDDVLKEDKSFLEDLIAAAVNDAVRRVELKNKENMSKLGAGFKMPDGFKMPF